MSVVRFAFAIIDCYSLSRLAHVEGGVKDAVISGETGWCINPNIDKEVDSAILDSFNNKMKRLQFGKNALKFFNENQSSHQVFEKLINLFN